MSELAYWFCGATLRDGRPVPADGVWLEHNGPIVICESGLHASAHPFDALQYAPSETLCLVELDGDIVTKGDKSVGRRCCIVARVDATPILREFARACASDVLHLWEAQRVAQEYLLTGDATAWAVAWAVAWAAARDAEWAAARAAARDAAMDAQRMRFQQMVDAAFNGGGE